MIVSWLILVTALITSTVPEGDCVLVNGSVGTGEWDGSGTLYLDSETEFLYHKNEENLFLAIAFQGPQHTGIDLYIHSNGVTRMLHVSAALGEKILDNGEWSEFIWGKNTWWTANQIGSIYENGQQRFLKPEAFEFQIDRRELGENLNLFIHLKRPEKMLPSGAVADVGEGWIQLSLE